MFSYYSYIFPVPDLKKNKLLEVSLSEKTKLGVDSSTMVSVSMDGHFQKYCTVEMGVAYHCCTKQSHSRLTISQV